MLQTVRVEWKIQVQIWNEMLLWAVNVNVKNSINVYNLLQCVPVPRLCHHTVKSTQTHFLYMAPESIQLRYIFKIYIGAPHTPRKIANKRQKKIRLHWKESFVVFFLPFSPLYISSFVISCSKSNRNTPFVYILVPVKCKRCVFKAFFLVCNISMAFYEDYCVENLFRYHITAML